VLRYIRGIREKDPGTGGTKLWRMYRKAFGVNSPTGRARFEETVGRYAPKVRAKVGKPKTTDSAHGLPVCPNIIKDFIPVEPNRLWVSDITYISIRPNEETYVFCHPSPILDAYAEEIVCRSVGSALEATYPSESLGKALKRMEGQEKVNLIRHSDRGCRYASREHVSL
jgi:transposase InsO family protein